MAVNKVVINDETKLDLTGDTVTPATLNQGVTAHNAAGEQIVGAQVPVATVNSIDPDDSGNVALTGGDIPMSANDSTTLAAKIAAKQSPTQNLDAETALADEDSFPFYDVSASANKRTLWSNIVAKLKSLFLPTTAGAVGATNLADGSVTAAKLAADAVRLTSANYTVWFPNWETDPEGLYSDFPYRAPVYLSGVTADMIPEVIFSPTDALSGKFAPVAKSDSDKIYIYATEALETDMVIPTIILWR